MARYRIKIFVVGDVLVLECPECGETHEYSLPRIGDGAKLALLPPSLENECKTVECRGLVSMSCPAYIVIEEPDAQS